MDAAGLFALVRLRRALSVEGLNEILERLSKQSVGHLVLDDPELVKQSLEKFSAADVCGPLVDLGGPYQHLQRVVEHLGAHREVGGQALEPLSNPTALSLDRQELLANLLLRAWRVGSEVDEVRLSRVEALELGRQLISKRSIGCLLVGERLADGSPQISDECRSESHVRSEVLDHCGFDPVDVDEGLGALVRLASTAEEVAVRTTVALGHLHDHPSIASGTVARAAPQQSLECVMELALSLSLCLPVEDGLDLVEELLADQRFVPALVLVALVNDAADVVAVAQQLVQLAVCDLGRGVPAWTAA